MIRVRLSLRQSILSMSIALGVAGIAAVLFSGRSFMTIAYETRKAAVEERLRYFTLNALQDLRRTSLDLGYALQKESNFGQALKQKKISLLRAVLNDQFAQYYTTAGRLKLEKLYIFDREYRLLEHSSKGVQHREGDQTICENLLRNAQLRAYEKRLASASGLCAYHGRTYFGVLMAMGLAPHAYLLVVTDPVLSIANLRKTMSEPLRIAGADRRELYVSSDWPQAKELGDYFFVEYTHPFELPLVGASQYAAHAGQFAFTLSAAQRIDKFALGVDRAVFGNILIATLIMIVAVSFAYYIQSRSLRPLRMLQNAAERFRAGRYEVVKAETYPEITQLMDAYNAMVERIAKLIHEIEETRRDAERSDRMKSRFLANMSHEIRTPLGVLLGYAELLADKDLEASTRAEYVQAIQSSGQHLRQMVNDVLDISKIEAGELQVERQEVQAISLLRELRAMFVKLVQHKGIEFRLDAVTPLPERIQTDATRLRQILINVVNNAIKFTPHGHVALSVSCRVSEKLMVFKVTDTGIGIKDEDLHRIFNAYQQAGVEISRQFGGTGLGLNLSRQLARLLGGDISVTSVYGRGSEFSVTVDTGDLNSVPFSKVAFDEPPSATPMVADVQSTIKFRGRVLIAEDTPAQRDLMKLVMKKLGVEVEFAENGEVAVRKARAGGYDLILMDMQMPVMDGIQAVQQLRAEKYTGPIFALSANTLDSDRKLSLDAGCDGYLLKPLERVELTKVMSRYLTNAEEAHPAVRK